MDKDFSSVSPSALPLIKMKALAGIPYAKEVAELLPNDDTGLFTTGKQDLSFWIRVMHFEARYLSIDQLLEGLGIRNIMELSSGYSFRGLDMAVKSDVHYIDTDLPEMIAQKLRMIDTIREHAAPLQGQLELLPLNALDSEKFGEIVSHFDKGPIAIVNEGLLMYLNTEEKLKLCKSIHKALSAHGGVWITTDIYIRTPQLQALDESQRSKEFFEQHNVEENKFESFEAAEAFFKSAGFSIEKRAEPDYSKLTALPKVMSAATPEQMEKMKGMGRIQETWMLKVI